MSLDSFIAAVDESFFSGWAFSLPPQEFLPDSGIGGSFTRFSTVAQVIKIVSQREPPEMGNIYDLYTESGVLKTVFESYMIPIEKVSQWLGEPIAQTRSRLDRLNIIPKRNYIIPTSITLDYRKRKWDLNRMVIDAVSNHLPFDSHGTSTGIWLNIGDQWVDFRQYMPGQQVSAIAITDDGIGYNVNLLGLLYSTKTLEDLSVGQFGEGLKLEAAAALRFGFGLDYRSQNWMARPLAKAVDLENIGMIQQLCFDVIENGSSMRGSQTTFYNPSQELIDAFITIGNNILYFNPGYKVLYDGSNSINGQLAKFVLRFNDIKITPVKDSSGILSYLTSAGLNSGDESSATTVSGYPSRIIDLGSQPHALYVKNVRIKDLTSIFSYDLGMDEVSPDRCVVEEETLMRSVYGILTACDNNDVVSTLLKMASMNEGYPFEFQCFDKFHPMPSAREREMHRVLEQVCGYTDSSDILVKINYIRNDIGTSKKSQASGFRSKGISSAAHRETSTPGQAAWNSAFKAIWGEKAVVASMNEDVNRDVAQLGYYPVKLRGSVGLYLSSSCAILAADNLVPKPDHTQDYRWADNGCLEERELAYMDTLQEINHLILGRDHYVPVRIYEDMVKKRTGEVVNSSAGVHLRNYQGQPELIGIRRRDMKTFLDFAHVYIHELGHSVSGKGDYDREFTDFFVEILTGMALGYRLGITNLAYYPNIARALQYG